jgi:hypothetical protein
MMPILNKLLWMKSCSLFVFWHKINMGIMLFRYSVFILDLVPSFFIIIRVRSLLSIKKKTLCGLAIPC